MTESSGGGSGINYAMSNELEKSFLLNKFTHINPDTDKLAKLQSKLFRILGLKGNYHYFSEKRLNKIKELFSNNKEDGYGYFFHGFTPWIKIRPSKPYYCFNDACFATYVEIYNNKAQFKEKDLQRIYKQEAEWLKDASKVFFRSKWALEQTKKHYGITGKNFVNAGVGGFIDIPKQDNYKGGLDFLFISREFIPKGGLTAVNALLLVRKNYPEARLLIVGDKPEMEILNLEGIVYKGFFKKHLSNEREELQEIFSKSFALVHPTIKDTNTLVITELAYFGCPAISTNRFAIPEYLLENETGFLLQDPRDENELAEKMMNLIEDSKLYRRMRIQARENAVHNNTWEKVGQRISEEIEKVLQ